ncbi:MAG: AAA family ATPase [Thermodesulfobacteriota bacterium]
MDRGEIFSKIKNLRLHLGAILKGKDDVIQLAVTALLAKGHLLIEDIPGVGKTTLAHGLAMSINCAFRRIQFTSDMLPSDVIGITVYNQADHTFDFKEGPIFANIILADEINRTSPRTQSAFLEAMNEKQVSVERVTYPLPDPFMVFATQNPLEYEGTFPLPESQLDRFTMRVKIGYPGEADERAILLSHPRSVPPANSEPVLSADELISIQSEVGKVSVDEELVTYILAVVNGTRNSPHLRLGVSPRGAIHLYRTAQALALVEGRAYCIPDDIKRLAVPVFAHRVVAAYDVTDGESASTDTLIEEIVETVAVPL